MKKILVTLRLQYIVLVLFMILGVWNTFPLTSANRAVHRDEHRKRDTAHDTYQNIDGMWNAGSVCGEILISWTQMAPAALHLCSY